MEFKRVPHGVFTPTKCALCGDHEGPFVDADVEWPAYGHVYICLPTGKRPGCIGQMARLGDFIPADTLAVALQTIEEMQRELSEMERKLNEERVVPLSELNLALNDLMEKTRSE